MLLNCHSDALRPLIPPALDALRSCVGLLRRFSGRYICGQRSGDLMEEFCRSEYTPPRSSRPPVLVSVLTHEVQSPRSPSRPRRGSRTGARRRATARRGSARCAKRRRRTRARQPARATRRSTTAAPRTSSPRTRSSTTSTRPRSPSSSPRRSLNRNRLNLRRLPHRRRGRSGCRPPRRSWTRGT